MTFVQRFGSALNLNPHLHVLGPDGVYVTGIDGRTESIGTDPIGDEDVQRIVETTAHRVIRLCQRRGLLEEGATDALWEEEPLPTTLTTAAVRSCVATGERAGQRVRRRLVDPEGGADVR